MVRTSVTHSAAPRVPLFCSYHILVRGSRGSSSRPVEARDNTDIEKTGHKYASVIRSTLAT